MSEFLGWPARGNAPTGRPGRFHERNTFTLSNFNRLWTSSLSRKERNQAGRPARFVSWLIPRSWMAQRPRFQAEGAAVGETGFNYLSLVAPGVPMTIMPTFLSIGISFSLPLP